MKFENYLNKILDEQLDIGKLEKTIDQSKPEDLAKNIKRIVPEIDPDTEEELDDNTAKLQEISDAMKQLLVGKAAAAQAASKTEKAFGAVTEYKVKDADYIELRLANTSIDEALDLVVENLSPDTLYD